MSELKGHEVQCPYCWEFFEILVDCSVADQRYIEDCEVCCRPIGLEVTVTISGEILVTARDEDS